MAQRKMVVGRTRVMQEADTMWLAMMTRKHTISELATNMFSLAVSSVVIEGNMMSDLLSERLSEVITMRLFLSMSLSSSLTSRRSKLTALL
ncbi:hypothetical protein EYF80_001269 [Liparis tanakae]|uniref:Uncharacterized protein n=1 Tax=Liparis tanakae TaxID=230148 RepID=A0A4Z2JE15_9TELE|nr:hypothetical protein EYF80_001269 [Liparis tanakae]